MAANRNLNRAKRVKQDEFYTQRSDIDNELKHYKDHFKGKVVYCNCDDPYVSNFFKYFAYNFEHLGLKKLIATCYKNQDLNLFSRHNTEQAIWLEYTGDKDGNRKPDPEEVEKYYLKGDGDFHSQECIEILKQADIVCTNPPFSLFREYVAQLVEYNKKFLIIGHSSAITYKEIFPLIKKNKMWLGYGRGDMEFQVPDHYPPKEHRYRMDENGKKFYSLGNAKWFTNLDIEKRQKKIILYKEYTPEEYPKYDNYDAIEVGRVNEIPVDYTGVMGVPISFLDKHNPDQFEILGCNRGRDQDPQGVYGRGSYLNGKETFKRLFIRNRRPQV